MGVTQCRYSIKDIKKDSSKLQDYLPSLKWECEEEKESQYLLWLKHGHMSIVTSTGLFIWYHIQNITLLQGYAF